MSNNKYQVMLWNQVRAMTGGEVWELRKHARYIAGSLTYEPPIM